MIRFQNASRYYGRKLAVDDLTLSVPRGELFALLGPNGAGKTTTIKMLTGLLRPSAGNIEVCGLDMVSRTREAVQCLGYVPDESFLYEKLSGREFLQFVAEMRGLGRAETAARIARETETFDLSSFLDDLAETYSHGMKQRLVFAAACLHDPAVLVVDEPMVGLDPLSTRRVKDVLCQRARAGATVFMSTHMLSVAEEIADRIGIVDAGHVSFLGTVGELRAQLAAPGAALEPLFLQLTGNGTAKEAS
jgi:ABC-2 type transport system ATP-binding protein